MILQLSGYDSDMGYVAIAHRTAAPGQLLTGQLLTREMQKRTVAQHFDNIFYLTVARKYMFRSVLC